jgi:hypothetical protein
VHDHPGEKIGEAGFAYRHPQRLPRRHRQVHPAQAERLPVQQFLGQLGRAIPRRDAVGTEVLQHHVTADRRHRALAVVGNVDIALEAGIGPGDVDVEAATEIRLEYMERDLLRLHRAPGLQREHPYRAPIVEPAGFAFAGRHTGCEVGRHGLLAVELQVLDFEFQCRNIEGNRAARGLVVEAQGAGAHLEQVNLPLPGRGLRPRSTGCRGRLGGCGSGRSAGALSRRTQPLREHPARVGVA